MRDEKKKQEQKKNNKEIQKILSSPDRSHNGIKKRKNIIPPSSLRWRLPGLRPLERYEKNIEVSDYGVSLGPRRSLPLLEGSRLTMDRQARKATLSCVMKFSTPFTL